MRLYHVSKLRYKTGHKITPSAPATREELHWWDQSVVYLSTRKVHETIASDKRLGWHIHEVRPIGKLKMGCYKHEFLATQAIVIGYIGVVRKSHFDNVRRGHYSDRPHRVIENQWELDRFYKKWKT